MQQQQELDSHRGSLIIVLPGLALSHITLIRLTTFITITFPFLLERSEVSLPTGGPYNEGGNRFLIHYSGSSYRFSARPIPIANCIRVQDQILKGEKLASTTVALPIYTSPRLGSHKIVKIWDTSKSLDCRGMSRGCIQFLQLDLPTCSSKLFSFSLLSLEKDFGTGISEHLY